MWLKTGDACCRTSHRNRRSCRIKRSEGPVLAISGLPITGSHEPEMIRGVRGQPGDVSTDASRCVANVGRVRGAGPIGDRNTVLEMDDHCSARVDCAIYFG